MYIQEPLMPLFKVVYTDQGLTTPQLLSPARIQYKVSTTKELKKLKVLIIGVLVSMEW